MGFVAGLILVRHIRRWKVAHTLVAIFAALLIGGSIVATLHGLSYLSFVHNTARLFHEENNLSDAQARELINTFLVDSTGASGFWGFLLFQAEQGMSIGKITSSSDTAISGIGVWLYWLFEAIVIVTIPDLMVFDAARAPFCSRCQ